MCVPGYVSKTGMVPCDPCPRGYFQHDSGKSFCFTCPNSAQTTHRGADSAEQCKGIIADQLHSLKKNLHFV